MNEPSGLDWLGKFFSRVARNVKAAGGIDIPAWARFFIGGVQVPTLTLLTTPLTSTSWDGDSYSTTTATTIDTSAVFGVPDGVKALLVRVTIRDSGGAANDCVLNLKPVGSSAAGLSVRCSGLTNDAYANGELIVPCDANGDIAYSITASGVGTMDVTLQIWGYWQ